MTAAVGETDTERLGRYVLEGRLGDGGMADVFRGRAMGAEGFARAVAIKRIRADVRRDPALAEMFVAEAKILAGLQHPNIVSVLDFDRDADGRLYLVMELVEGQDLGGLLASGPLPYSTIIFVQAAPQGAVHEHARVATSTARRPLSRVRLGHSPLSCGSVTSFSSASAIRSRFPTSLSSWLRSAGTSRSKMRWPITVL